MTTPDLSQTPPSLYNGRPKPRASAAHANPTDEHYALTAGQREILAMLEGRPQPLEDSPSPAVTSGFGLDVLFATLGVVAILAGAVLVFFFAAAGALVLVMGAICCAVAFEHGALREGAAAGGEHEATAAPRQPSPPEPTAASVRVVRRAH